MDMKIRALSSKHNVKISIVDISETMQHINDLQKTNIISAGVLSQFTTAVALLSMEFKGTGKVFADLTTEDGIIQNMKVIFSQDKIGSYIRIPDFDLTNITTDLLNEKVIGTLGTLLIEYSSEFGEPYVSQVHLDKRGIDYTFNNYLRDSNQIGSLLLTSIKLNEKTMKYDKVAGILIQLLPGHTEEDIEFLEKKLGTGTAHLNKVLQNSTNYESLIKDIAEDAIVLESKKLEFACSCSKEKMLNAIKMIDSQALKEILESNSDEEVVCEFCKTKYVLSNSEIRKILN